MVLFSFLGWIEPCSKPGWVKTLQIGREGEAMFGADQIHSCARPADAADAAKHGARAVDENGRIGQIDLGRAV
jgi:hypothetical protein